MAAGQLKTQDLSPLYLRTDGMKIFHQISLFFTKIAFYFGKSVIFSLRCTDEISILRQSMHTAPIWNKLYNNFLSYVAKTHVKPNPKLYVCVHFHYHIFQYIKILLVFMLAPGLYTECTH